MTSPDLAPSPTAAAAPIDHAASRRQLVSEGLGIAVSAVAFGFVYGLAARETGFSPVETMAMSVIVFAGAAQFAAVGYVAAGLPWPGIILLTALLNARHLLYSVALGPWVRQVSFPKRALMAHLLTDEAFALSISHFRRLGWTDMRGYWIGAIGATFIPWNLASLAGALVGGQIPDPNSLGIDIIFPAAMIGLSVGLITGRRELVAAMVGAIVGVGAALLTDSPAVGIIIGGIVGPAVGLLVPEARSHERAPLGSAASAERFAMPGAHFHEEPDREPGTRPSPPPTPPPDETSQR